MAPTLVLATYILTSIIFLYYVLTYLRTFKIYLNYNVLTLLLSTFLIRYHIFQIFFQIHETASACQSYVVYPDGFKPIPSIPIRNINPTKIIKSGQIKILPPKPKPTRPSSSLAEKAGNSNLGGSHPRPPYSYANLIVMALKNSISGCLSVNNIYKFVCETFPFFDNPKIGTNWQNAVRHTLSLHKGFIKSDHQNPLCDPNRTNAIRFRKFEWTINPAMILKLHNELFKSTRKDVNAIKVAMANPEQFEALLQGRIYIPEEIKAASIIAKTDSQVQQIQVDCEVQINSDYEEDEETVDENDVEIDVDDFNETPPIISEVCNLGF